MIYIEINNIVREFRRALALDTAISDDMHVLEQIAALEKANSCTIVGSYDAGGRWCTDGIAFPNEQSLAWFRLKWA